MKFKLDENVGETGKAVLQADGHDVMTVADQKHSGAVDEALFQRVENENRALITLDRDFGEVLRFPPEQTVGIIVLSIVGRMSMASITARVSELVVYLRSEDPSGHLWIAEPGRLCIHQKRS